MFAFVIPASFDVPRLASELNRRSAESVRHTRASAVSSATAISRFRWLATVGGILAVFITIAAGQSALLAFTLFCAAEGLALLLGRRLRRHAWIARLLTELTPDEVGLLSELADQSDVVRVMWRKAIKAHRPFCGVDLVYARNLMVRELRNGSKASDLLPLEQTRRYLSPSHG